MASHANVETTAESWPALPLESWQPTLETLHRWTQIVGKTRLALAPFQNHWWHCTLYVSARGLTTSSMPHASGNIEVEFDFLDDALVVRTSDGHSSRMLLPDKSVASFYREYREMLEGLGVELNIHAAPNELADATPFAEDTKHATYDGDAARRWWTATTQVDHALQRFRSRFVGKCSPSHFWWGGFDLACTRFSGRPAPRHPGGIPNCPNYVTYEAYSHECISAGWWPGVPGSPVAEPAFYAYAYPEPDGCQAARIEPSAASYSAEMREWVLPYEAVRTASKPQAMVAEFLESTYVAAATLAKWDIDGLRSSHALRP